MSKPTYILFLCVANSSRSQLAEGLAKSLFGNKAIIQSAGSKPSGNVQTWAIKVLMEDEIDISKNWSKSIDQLSSEFLANLDYVITLCEEEVCPVFISNAKLLHWPIKDPAKVNDSEKAEAFRKAKLEILSLLTEFKEKSNKS